MSNDIRQSHAAPAQPNQRPQGTRFRNAQASVGQQRPASPQSGSARPAAHAVGAGSRASGAPGVQPQRTAPARQQPGASGRATQLPSPSRTLGGAPVRKALPATGAKRARMAQDPAKSGVLPATASRGGQRGASATHRAKGTRHAARSPQKRKPIAAIVAAAIFLIALVCVGAFVVVPAVKSMTDPASTVEAGKTVRVSIPEGASGDTIAAELSSKHVIEDPKDYYAAVKSLGADTSLKPGEYEFTTLMDAKEVVQQLMQGPNASGSKLVVPEGYTVEQVASTVESSLGISADDFKAQAKASNYVSEYSFLKDAYNDSLEGYLYPKSYTFTSDSLSADTVIRKMLDQFASETGSLKLSKGANGLTGQQIVTLASLVERETAVDSERAKVASVIYNRLDKDMFLQIDAAIVYARGGGNSAVTYNDLKIDSPYNVYTNKGLTPGPICSPSIGSIKAALNPESTNYLYYVASSANDGSHKFTSSYEEFESLKKEYTESQS